MSTNSDGYISRGGEKLAAALDQFNVGVEARICADLGSHVGGFVDCLLRCGAKRVYSVDTSYGTLAWRLRRDRRVVVMERTNAMHVSIPEPVDVVTVDVGWTKQTRVLPNVINFLAPSGLVITLLKPHYEAPGGLLVDGVLPDEVADSVAAEVLAEVASAGWIVEGTTPSPIRGHAGNREVFALLRR